MTPTKTRTQVIASMMGGLFLLLCLFAIGETARADYARVERGNYSVLGRLAALAGINLGSQATTCGGTDAGGGTFACTLGPPYPTYTQLTCNDSFGCVMTMSETSATIGDLMIIQNAGTNTLKFSDSSGVSELQGDFTMQSQDELTLIYGGAAWFEVSRLVNASTSTATCANVPGVGSGALTIGPPYPQVLLVTDNDVDGGCNITLSETSAKSGDVMRIVNVSANTISFSDSSGVSETAGAFVAGQWDSITFVYAGSTWVELARSNN